MGQTTDELRSHIEDQRDRFEGNLNEIESRVKHATDWRAQFDERPMLFLGVAFGGGMLLGMLLGGGGDDDSGKSQQRPMYQPYARANGSPGTMSWLTGSQGPHTGTDVGRNKAAEQLDSIRGALMGVGAAKLEDFLRQSVSGFDQEMEHVQRKKEEEQGGQAMQSQPDSQSTDRSRQHHTPTI